MSEEVPDGQLETITKGGKPPKPSRLNSASSAWAIVSRIINRDEERSRKRAKIQGQIDGNPPYSASAMKRMGQGNRSNVNFRQAEGIRDSRKTSYYELLMEVDTLVEVDIPDDYLIDNDVPQVDYGQIIAEEFTKTLQQWEGFWYNTLLHQEQYVTWGIGNCYWENPIDWRFKAARAGAFLIPDGTKSMLSDFDLIVIRGDYKPHKLFEKVKDKETEEASREAGWNIPLVREMIRKVAEKQSTTDQHSLGDWESLQAKIKENDLEYSFTDQEPIYISHLIYKEYSGKISHMIIVEDSEICNKKDAQEKQKNWLFRDVEQFDEWKHVVCTFFAGIGEGTVHSIRGLGARIFAHCVINDRLLNTTVDGSMTSATILLQPTNDAQKERLRMVRVGPFSIMPAGYNVIQHGSFQPNLQGLVSVHNLLSANLNQNNGMYRPDVTQEEKTPQAMNQQELRNRATKEAKLEKADINVYYTQWDCLYTEVLRKMLNPSLTDADPGGKEAKAFIKRCLDRNVPRELMKPDMLTIMARRAIGFGSPVMQSMITADILSVSACFDEKGKDNAVRDYVSARAGQRAVKRYKPARNRNEIPDNDASIAALENNDLREGQECLVGVDQPHVLHIIRHIAPLVQIAEAYINGEINPESAYVYLQTALRHISQHLDFISTDPSRQNEYRSFMTTFTELTRISDTMTKQAKRIQQQRQKEAEENAATVEQARQQSQSGDMQAKLMKVQGDLQLRAMKEEGNQRVREAKALHGMQIAEMKARHDMMIREMEAERE